MTENRITYVVTYERASPDITEFDYDIGNASPKIMAACSYFDARGRASGMIDNHQSTTL